MAIGWIYDLIIIIISITNNSILYNWGGLLFRCFLCLTLTLHFLFCSLLVIHFLHPHHIILSFKCFAWPFLPYAFTYLYLSCLQVNLLYPSRLLIFFLILSFQQSQSIGIFLKDKINACCQPVRGQGLVWDNKNFLLRIYFHSGRNLFIVNSLQRSFLSSWSGEL